MLLMMAAALQIDWKAGPDAALAEAKKAGRPVMLFFSVPGSEAGYRM